MTHRILIVSSIWPPAVGGPASHAPELGAYLKARGHDVRALIIAEPDAEPAAFRVRRISPGGPLPVRLVRGAAGLLPATTGVDAMYATGMYHRVAMAARARRLPTVIKLVNDPAYERARSLGLFDGTLEDFQGSLGGARIAALKRARTIALREADWLVVPSRYLAEHVQRWVGPRARVEVVPNPAPDVAPSAPRARLRSRFGLHRPTLVFAGRLVPQKNLELALRALSLAPGMELVLVGDGPEQGAVERWAVSYGVAERLRLVGAVPRTEVLDWLAAADAALLSSAWENHPHAAIEALAVGTPVVATAVGGVPEIVEDDESGALVAPGDAEGLAAAMQRVAGDPRVNAALRARIASRPAGVEVEQAYGRIEALLDEVIGEPRAAPRPDAPSSAHAVLHVMRMSGVSGSENHLLELARVQAAAGWAVDVLIPSPEPRRLDAYVTELAASCRSVRVIPMSADFSPRLVTELRAAMRGGYAVVHTHLVHADWHAALAAATVRARPMLVSTKHNHDPFRRRMSARTLETATTRPFDHVIAISDSLRDFTADTSGVQATTVRYGLRPPRVRAVERAPHELLAVGRLEPQKGLDVLLRAMPAIAERFPDVTLRIAGSGGEREALERLSGELGLDGRVEFLGQRTDVLGLMARAGLLVHPARWEGFGLVLLEAMAASLPVVASGVGGIVEVVADGETGTLVAPEDPAALAAAIIALLADPARAAAMGAAGRRRLETAFSPERMGRETIAIYERLLAAAP